VIICTVQKNNMLEKNKIYCVYSTIVPVMVLITTWTIFSCVKPTSMTILHTSSLRLADLNTTGELYCSKNFLAICIALRIFMSVSIDKKSLLSISSSKYSCTYTNVICMI